MNPELITRVIDESNVRFCTTHKKLAPIDDFTKYVDFRYNDNGTEFRKSRCKKCELEYQARYRMRHGGKTNKYKYLLTSNLNEVTS